MRKLFNTLFFVLVVWDVATTGIGTGALIGITGVGMAIAVVLALATALFSSLTLYLFTDTMKQAPIPRKARGVFMPMWMIAVFFGWYTSLIVNAHLIQLDRYVFDNLNPNIFAFADTISPPQWGIAILLTILVSGSTMLLPFYFDDGH